MVPPADPCWGYPHPSCHLGSEAYPHAHATEVLQTVGVKRMMWALTALAAASLLVAFALAVGTRPVPWTAVVYMVTVPATFVAAGVIVLWKRPESRAGWLLVCATAFSLCFPLLLEVVVNRRFQTHGHESWMAPLLAGEALTSMLGLAALVLLIALFPTGRPQTPLQRHLAVAAWLLPLPMIFALLSARNIPVEAISYEGVAPFANPYAQPWLVWLDPVSSRVRSWVSLAVLAAVVALVIRYRGETPSVRRQLRWILFGTSAAITFAVLPWVALPLLGPEAILHGTLLVSISSASLALLPASVVIAILQPPWIDTDRVIPRGLAYGLLSVLIVVLYLGLAAGFGLAVGTGLPVEVAVLIAVAIAVAFHPARIRLQRLAERWVFGARPTPMDAVASLDDTMHRKAADSALAPHLAELVRQVGRLRWAEVELPPASPAVAGTRGSAAVFTTPIGQEGQSFGSIHCGPKIAGSFTDNDRGLVLALAAQTALLLANTQLAGRIVQAQEAERRRIERNIHDGTQQELVALVAKLALARTQLARGQLQESTFVELQDDARSILRDLRDLAQGIHPTVLTDGGLVEAVEDRCSRLPIRVTLETSPGLRQRRFSDDIEGAAFFFVAEGLANALKHAQASSVLVGLQQVGGYLELSVSDDGTGFNADLVRTRGLDGLSDRITALAGSLRIEPIQGTGTLLRARLPVITNSR